MLIKYSTGTLEKLELRKCNDLELNKVVDAGALFRNMKELALCRTPAIDGSFLSDSTQLIHLNMNGFYSKKIVKSRRPRPRSIYSSGDESIVLHLTKTSFFTFRNRAVASTTLSSSRSLQLRILVRDSRSFLCNISPSC